MDGQALFFLKWIKFNNKRLFNTKFTFNLRIFLTKLFNFFFKFLNIICIFSNLFRNSFNS